MKVKANHFANIKLILKIYALVLGIFSIFRIILFFTGTEFTENDGFGTIMKAFIMGLRFDIVISGYILFFPFIALSLIDILKPRSNLAAKIIFYFTFVVFTLAFIVCAIDIPYFGQFFSRFSVLAFQWLESPAFVFKMIMQEFRYIGYIIPLLLLIPLFFFALKRMFVSFMYSPASKNWVLHIILSLCTAGLMFIGIRGRLEQKSPIRVGTAYFSNNAFLNQLGLNPNFTLFRSIIDYSKTENQKVHFMDNEEALHNVQQYLHIHTPDSCSPVLRRIVPDSVSQQKPNIVIILMESMSAVNMQRFGNQKNLTPFLDSLANVSYSFENIYSAGIHTYNGVFSTLFSFPAIYHQRNMQETDMPRYHGMASVLKQHGYQNIYFTTHDGQFDNIEGFLKANDFDKVVSQSDYPADKVVSTLGVPDDYMFEFSLPVLNGLYKNGAPFFATFLTVSNHGPYHIPPYFIPTQKDIKEQVIEYSDWSLRKFVMTAAQEPWFKHTVFVFIADHGLPINAVYEMPLNYHHTPLIMYAPEIITQPQSFAGLGGQIDVFPSVMHILQLPYTNNTLGIDLLSEERPFIYFSADDKYGVVSDSLFLIIPNNGEEGLYRYREADKTNYINQYQKQAKAMKTYAQSNMQASQYIVSQRKQSCK